MTNKSATSKLSVTYTDAEGAQQTLGPLTVISPYQAQSHGALDVPDSEASATVHAVPFGGIGVAATLVVIENNTGQELGVKINGAAAVSDHIAPGGMRFFGEAAAPGAVPILSLTLTTTAMQTGAGSIGYHLFGDPV